MGDKSTTDAPEGETSDSPAAAKDIVQRYRFRVRMADGRELVSRVATVTRPAPVTQARIDPHVACAQPSGMEGDALPVELSLELDTPAVLPLVMLLLGTEGDAQVFTDADCKKELGGLDVSMFKENKLPLWVHGSGDVALTLTVTSKPSSNAKPGMPATVQLTYHSFLGVRVVDSSGAVVTGLKVQIASDKESREQTLAQDRLTGDGSFRFDRIPAGKYKVSLPELDASLWGAAADPVPAARFVRRELAVPPGGHVIAPGDDIWTLGVRYAVQPSAMGFPGQRGLQGDLSQSLHAASGASAVHPAAADQMGGAGLGRHAPARDRRSRAQDEGAPRRPRKAGARRPGSHGEDRRG